MGRGLERIDDAVDLMERKEKMKTGVISVSLFESLSRMPLKVRTSQCDQLQREVGKNYNPDGMEFGTKTTVVWHIRAYTTY